MKMLLAAPDPASWIATHLTAHFDGHGGAVDPSDTTFDARWFSIDQLLADDGAMLRAGHSRLMTEESLPARGAATYLAGWVGGGLADAVGFVLATAGAGFLVTAGGVRWHQHVDGWVDRVDLGDTRIVVPAGHPWSGCEGVDTVGDPEIVREMSVLAMVAVVTPIIDLCHSLTRVGRAGLWNEVGDAFGTAVAFQTSVPVEPEVVDSLAAAGRTRGVPWRAQPILRIAERAAGPVYVAQKGGCCLAYTRPPSPVENLDDLDLPYRMFLERFPPEQKQLCTTCSLRDFADCEARQLFWLDCTEQATVAADT